MKERTFLFITFNENERTAFLKKLDNQKEETFHNGVVVTNGKFGKYDVVHFHSPYQGNESQMPVMNAIQIIKPDAVILVGIACGANVEKRNQHIGDVLVSKNVIDYDFHKDNNGKIEQRGITVPSGNILYSLFSQRAFKWKEKYNLAYHCGDIISSTVLLNNPEKKKEIFDAFNGNPKGYEMEGISTVRICRDVNIQEWIIVKGISDFGDGNKRDNYQVIASENAVSLCHHVFSQEGLNSVPKVWESSENNDASGSVVHQVNGDILSENAKKTDLGKNNTFGNVTINF